jgi:hypothetical protein
MLLNLRAQFLIFRTILTAQLDTIATKTVFEELR